MSRTCEFNSPIAVICMPYLCTCVNTHRVSHMDFYTQLNLYLLCQILLDRSSEEIMDQMREGVAISQDHVRAVCVGACVFTSFLSKTQDFFCTDMQAKRCPLLKQWKQVVKGKRAGKSAQEEEKELLIEFLSTNSAHLQHVISD